MSISKDVYVRYYRQQHGGSLPVFRGGRHDQDGAGFGSILSGIFRRVAPFAMRYVVPAATRGISSFAKNMIQAQQQGVPFGEAAKAAALSAVGDAARAAVGGKRRAMRKRQGVAMTGGDGTAAASVPKRRKRARKSTKGQQGAGKRRKRQAGAGKRRRNIAQKGGKKRVYKKKQAGGNSRRAATKKRGGRAQAKKGRAQTKYHF